MKKITHLLLGLFLFSTAGTFVVSCNDTEKKLADKEKELQELRQLAELDKREMENQYAEFASQYGELKKSVKDDSLIARLNEEQARAEALLKELKNTKANSSAEILRLKKELATVRAVLRDYIRQVDSLQHVNQALIGERDEALAAAARTRVENTNIQAENTQLNEQVVHRYVQNNRSCYRSPQSFPSVQPRSSPSQFAYAHRNGLGPHTCRQLRRVSRHR